MVNPVTGGAPPTYPFPEVMHLPANPPDAIPWNQLSFVLGGFWNKALFFDSAGYEISSGSIGNQPAQWNIRTMQMVYVDSLTTTRRPYQFFCMNCHTTGAVAADSADVAHHWQNRPGVWGNWAEPGIGCEACHGPGSAHVATQNPDSLDRAPLTACQRCHTRGDSLHRPRQDGAGWLANNQQYDELSHSPMSFLDCTQCHNPHKSVVYDQGGVTPGATCSNCHTSNYQVQFHDTFECQDCHMAEWDRSGQTFNPYQADVRDHFFSINVTAQPRESSFVNIGGTMFVRLDDEGHGAIPLDVACLKCHVDSSLQWASAFATNIHVAHPASISARLISTVPGVFALGPCYPNPFNPTTTVPFVLSTAGHARLAVYNVLGQEVAVLVNEHLVRGSYAVAFDARGLAGGIYLARLTAGERVQTGKLLLLK
jgi:predicted CXXCH cytochrome family protein